ncbi:MAG: hypothetical protein ACXW09_11915 [Methylococcaceae bacterium]
MSLKKRLNQLEQQQSAKNESFQIAIFVVIPGVEPKGYICEGITVLREPEESVESLQQRARQAVLWPQETCRKIFHCLE